MNAATIITSKQKQIIHILISKKELNWPESQYRQWLHDVFGANSCLDLNVEQARQAIRMLRDISLLGKPDYLTAATLDERKAAWSRVLFTDRALSGLIPAELGKPPFKKTITEISTGLWHLSRRADNQAKWVLPLLRCTIGKDQIETQAEAEKMRGVIISRERQNKRKAQAKTARKKYQLKK